MLTLLFICTLYIAYGELVGPINITENGQVVTRYVVSTYSPLASTNGTAIMLQHNSQIQIAKEPAANYTPAIFMEYKLAGATLSYTTDLSAISCSCNSALYLVSMPAIGSNGQPVGGQSGDFYCDANDVNKEWCWEFDIQEANKYTTAVTPHTCSQDPGTYITACDRGGCGTNAHNVDGNGICPADNCKINTNKPFRYSIHFGSTFHVTLSQNGQTFQFDSCNNGGYVQNMQKALNYGMGIVASYLGSTY
eukprot:UN04815